MAAHPIMREDSDVRRQLIQADTMTSAEKIRLAGTATDRVRHRSGRPSRRWSISRAAS